MNTWSLIAIVVAVISALFSAFTYFRLERTYFDLSVWHVLSGLDFNGVSYSDEAIAANPLLGSGHVEWVLKNTGVPTALNLRISFDFDPNGVRFGRQSAPDLVQNESVTLWPESPKEWPSIAGPEETWSPPEFNRAFALITWTTRTGRDRHRRVRVRPREYRHA